MDNNFKHQIERLVVIMEEWANWQKGYSGIRGFSSHSAGLQSGFAASKSFDDMYDESQEMIAGLVDAAVDDLPAGQAAAINRRYGIAAVFRFPRGIYEDLLSEAHVTLMVTLPRKGVVI